MNTQNFIYCILRKIFGFFKTNYFSKFTAPKLITMAQNPIAVANYFIKKANDEGIELTLMKLVKLVYIAHGWHLALKDNELIDEAVQAWKYGPVVPSVYQVFKRFGNAQVTQAGYIVEDGQLITPTITDEDEKHFLDEVWEVYKKYDGLQLSTLTHQPKTPWDIVWNKEGGNKRDSALIRNQLIKDHYLTKVKKQPDVA